MALFIWQWILPVLFVVCVVCAAVAYVSAMWGGKKTTYSYVSPRETVTTKVKYAAERDIERARAMNFLDGGDL